MANYILQEMQTTNGTTALIPAVVYTDRAQAESAFHMVCASACLSSVPVHTVAVFTEEGFQIPELTRCYKHNAVE